MKLGKTTGPTQETAQPVRRVHGPVVSCGHPKCPPWKSKSIAGRTCPCWVINDNIAEIKKIQSGIEESRGVWGSSKQQHQYDAQFSSHKDWMQKWQRAKILCTEAVELLNKLNDENPAQAEGWGIKQALSIWHSAAEGCGKVPGYSYVQEKLDVVAEMVDKDDTMRKSSTHKEKPLSPQELQEPWADDREFAVKPKRKSRKSSQTSSTTPPAPTFSSSRTHDKTFHPKPKQHQCTDTQAFGVDDYVLKEMEDVISRLHDRRDIGCYEFFNAVTNTGIEMIQIVEESEDPLTLSISSPPVPKAIEDANLDDALLPSPPILHSARPTTTPAKEIRRSALKGTRALTSPSLQHTTSSYPPHMKLDFSNYATVFPNNTHAGSSSLPEPPIQQPHHKYTDAESSHVRNLYQRSSPFYDPYTAQWSSPNGYCKVETSFNYETWDYLETFNKHEGKELSPVKSEYQLSGDMANGPPMFTSGSMLSELDSVAAMNALKDELAEAMIDEDKVVEQEVDPTKDKSASKREMQMILHSTTTTNASTKCPPVNLAKKIDTATDIDKQVILRPKPGEPLIVDKQSTYTTSVSLLRSTRNWSVPPLSPAPKSPAPKQQQRADLLSSIQTVSTPCNVEHRLEGKKVQSGLTFGVAERESER